ncbi:MAG TPA: DNA translocase FtsK, partial [Anaerolineae bacterium]
PPGAGPSAREPVSSRPAAGLAARAAAALAALRAELPAFGHDPGRDTARRGEPLGPHASTAGLGPHASTAGPVRPAGARPAPPEGENPVIDPSTGMRPSGRGAGPGRRGPGFTIPLTQETAGLALALFGLVLAGWLVLGWLVGGSTAMFLWILFGWGAPVVALGLILGGAALALAERRGWTPRWGAVAAGELLFVLVLTLVHLAAGKALALALLGEGGGVVGWGLGQLLLKLGEAPAWALAAAAALAAGWWLWRSLPPAWTAPVAAVLGQLLHNLGVPDDTTPAADGEAWPEPGSEPEPLPEPAPRRRSRPILPEPAAPAPAPQITRPAPARPAAAPVDDKKVAGRGPQRKRPASLPPLDLLTANGETHPAPNTADARSQAQTLKQTLLDFGVPVEIVSIKEGPTVTQFGVEPGEFVREMSDGEIQRRKVPVSKIIRLGNDLALALAAPGPIRIEAPVPGRPYVGVEIPNPRKSLVSLRPVLETKEFARVRSPLAIALGRDVAGDPVVADLARMPHLLIAGATGSGKSVCINAIVASLLMNNRPDTLRLLMIDPKMVELPAYNGIPHLVAPVVTDVAQTTAALAWLTLQMDGRYRRFADLGVRNIEDYNALPAKRRGPETLPYIVLIIDELADLMMVAPDDVERQVCRLAQLSRATGIHLVLATQRPSVDVITGLIKANFPARIAFAVATQIDSRVILDGPGADKLLGRGDMLLMTQDSAKLARVQGCYVSDQEIDRLVAFWQNARPDDEPAEPATLPWAGLLEKMEAQDDLLEKALTLLRGKRQVSTSLLQRQLRIGFPRAARLMEQLEEMGAVGPDEGGGRSRQVFLPDSPTDSGPADD